MRRKFAVAALIVGFVILQLPVIALGRTSNSTADRRANITAAAGSPAHCAVEHNIGKIALTVNNNGTLGWHYSQSGSRDCFTNELLSNCEYPKGSSVEYLYGAAFWIGAVVGRDTLVSVGQDGWSGPDEFNPPSENDFPSGEMIRRSIIDPSKEEFKGAISEQDYIALYLDTCQICSGVGQDPIDGRSHIPLFIEVSQRSYSWSYSYAEDFVLFDYAIKNVGINRLNQVYMGIYVDADVHDIALGGGGGGAQDDLCGFLHTISAQYMPDDCPAIDTVNLAYIHDADGDMNKAGFRPAPHVTGARVVRTPSDSLKVSFNWWVGNSSPSFDYGPQTRAKFRDLSTGGQGTPQGDRNKYWFLSNGEFDFDQVMTASISSLDTLWTTPPANARAWSRGIDTRYLLSFGPFDIDPGQTLPLSLAYIAGENLHTDPDNWTNNLDEGYNPVLYQENLNFDDLGLNAIWASWVYDNPGVDTDSDGYFGKSRICETIVNNDTLREVIWYEGDGVPDFRGASPPPAPSLTMRIEPTIGKVKIIWNGHASETAEDIFSRLRDFEGYRVWRARDDRPSSYTLVSSYDVEDFNKWVFSGSKNDFILIETPYPLDSLRLLYAPNGEFDSTWHPLDYPRSRPYLMSGSSDSAFFFEIQDYNRSHLGNEPMSDTDIRKPYPNAVKPPSRWTVDSVLERFGGDSNPFSDSLDIYLTDLEITDLGDTLPRYLRFYEYEYTISNLLPTVPYWFNVTAFDFGSPQSGLASLETSVSILPKVSYALESVNSVAAKDLQVYIYPNPYRLDATYLDRGFEGRFGEERSQAPDRVRRVHFANLPPKCIISIFSIDGDLIAEIDHDILPTDPLANHDSWNLITRNTQQVVSGIYYWTVEVPNGQTQIGKLVIIM